MPTFSPLLPLPTVVSASFTLDQSDATSPADATKLTESFAALVGVPPSSVQVSMAEAVETTVSLAMSCADFVLSAVKQSLAVQYQVAAASLTVSNPCAGGGGGGGGATRRSLQQRATSSSSSSGGGGGTLVLDVVIASSAAASDGNSIPMAELLAKVEEVDSAELTTALSIALNETVAVQISQPAEARVVVVVSITVAARVNATAVVGKLTAPASELSAELGVTISNEPEVSLDGRDIADLALESGVSALNAGGTGGPGAPAADAAFAGAAEAAGLLALLCAGVLLGFAFAYRRRRRLRLAEEFMAFDTLGSAGEGGGPQQRLEYTDDKGDTAEPFTAGLSEKPTAKQRLGDGEEGGEGREAALRKSHMWSKGRGGEHSATLVTDETRSVRVEHV
jgi:hypothetical protein